MSNFDQLDYGKLKSKCIQFVERKDGNLLYDLEALKIELNQTVLVSWGCGLGEIEKQYLIKYPDSSCILLDNVEKTILSCQENLQEIKEQSRYKIIQADINDQAKLEEVYKLAVEWSAPTNKKIVTFMNESHSYIQNIDTWHSFVSTQTDYLVIKCISKYRNTMITHNENTIALETLWGHELKWCEQLFICFRKYYSVQSILPIDLRKNEYEVNLSIYKDSGLPERKKTKEGKLQYQPNNIFFYKIHALKKK
jgi:hypothetical protein